MTTHNVKSQLLWELWLLTLLACASAYFWLPEVLTSALEGESLHHLNRLVIRNHLKEPAVRTATYYTQLAQSFTLRAILIWTLFGGLTMALLTVWRQTLIDFFTRPTSAINLAVFRIVVFYLAVRHPTWTFLHRFRAPLEELDAPPGWDFIVNAGFWFPNYNEYAIYGFKVFAYMALFGLFTRYTAPLAALFGFVVLGIPQFFGKINHYHHVWVFMLYCSLSPCGDALSIDRLLFERKKPMIASKYRWPLAWAGVTIGILYFFPGVWKFMVGGPDWIFSDNLTNKMRTKWFETGFTPPVRIDNYPVVMMMGALNTILFESLFLFAIFHPVTRWINILVAASFHQMTVIFMGISFGSLVSIYVVFIDWPLLWDCIRTLSIKPLLSRSGLPARWFGLQPPTCASEEPMFKLLNSADKPLGVDLKAANHVGEVHHFEQARASFLRWWHWTPATYCGLMLICGITLIDTWPICVYPTFASIEKPYFKTLYVEKFALGSSDPVEKYVPIRNEKAIAKFRGAANLQSFSLNLSAEKDQKHQQDMARTILKSLNADLTTGVAYKFYLTLIPTDPDLEDPKPNMEKSKFLLQLAK
jgi:hypothetical protein